jgi:thiol-disulfide isomerase/thioredoxin
MPKTLPASSVFASVLIVAAVAAVAGGQPAGTPPALEVRLRPAAEDSPVRLGWSPKGATVRLTAADADADGDGDALVGRFPLGRPGTPPVAVRLERSPGATYHDRLLIDTDRSGVAGDRPAERRSTVPREQRGKWWSSFSATVSIPMPGRAAPRPYPMSLWFVADPQEPDAAPALRWSRRGWHEGQVEIDGRPAYVLITEMMMDGVFDRRDAWMIARDPADLGRRSRSLSEHAWLDGVAYLPSRVDEHGRGIAFAPFDPGYTEAEEAARADVYRVDREAPRAATPLAFGDDLEAALATARANGTQVFLDFETTWCGPCKQMNQWVYTAAAVVAAAERTGVVPVKLDGDEERELVRRYGVRGYPTMLLLDADGREVKRAVGYRSVAEMAAFLGGE